MIHCLTQSQISELLSKIEDRRDKLMIWILYETGCSLKELSGIKAGDVGGNMVRMRSPLRFARISGNLSKAISLYIKGNGLAQDASLLSTRQSRSISVKRIRQIINNYTMENGFGKINPIMFRYYHIANAYQSGVFIENIAKQLGLTSLRVFQVIAAMGLKPKTNYNMFLGRI